MHGQRNIKNYVLYSTLENDSELATVDKKIRVKVTLVQALKLCTGRTAHRGRRGIALRDE